MKRRILAVLLCAAMIIGMLPMISQTASAAPSTTASEVDTLFKARSQGKHPRVLADESDFQRIRKLVKTDPYMKTWYAQVYDYSEGILGEPLCKYELPDGKRLLNVSREASQRITWLALTYQISGEYRFAERAIKEMINVCSFKDWHPSHFLDVGQMAYGVGLGYDWLYHELTSAQRTTIAKAIYNYAIVPFDGGWYQTSDSNWNPWCHGGVAIGACAIYESYSSACKTFLANAVKNIQYSIKPYTPLGGYPEGPGYYIIGMTFTVYFIEALRSVLGTDFGLTDMKGMREAGNYLPGMNGFVNTFNYGDGSPALMDMPALHWFANFYNMPHLSLYQRENEVHSADIHMSLLWYNPEIMDGISADDQQLDHLIYSDYYQSIASFRSDNGNAAKIYAAIKSGSPGSNHSDMDVGTFVMEAMGERWFMEMGSDNYNVTGYFSMDASGGRWTYYKKRAEGQNTLVINPDKTGGQVLGSKCQIEQYKSGAEGGYAVVNMLDAYDSYGVSKAKRGLMMFDNRSRVLLRDEITCTKSSTIYWFAHTRASIKLSSDKKTAELTLNGKKLMAQIASPSNAVFSVMDAKPLSTSPAPAGTGEHSREGIRKLTICLKNVTSANISVVFTPIVENTDSSKSATSVSLSSFASKVKGYASGTTLKPNSSGVYEIRNADQLALFAEMVNGGNSFSGKTVKLMNDIDMQNRTLTPIGGTNTGYAFQGTFDGGKHVIRNFSIFQPGVSQVGLFGKTNGAKIKNVGIESGYVFGGGQSGCLIGIGNNTTVEGCFNMANFIGNGGHVGGLIGQAGGTITIKNSYNNANISNKSNIAGGLIGYISSNSTVTIQNSYHSGSLSDSAGHCGLIGYYNSSAVKKVTMNKCLSTTSLKSSAVKANSSRESYTNSTVTSKDRLVSRAIWLGSAFMDDCDWDNEGCPVLAWQVDAKLPSNLRLSTAAQLRLLAYTVNSGKNTFSGKTVYLTQDIDLDSREWVPIGGDADSNGTRYDFRGTFDGQGYSIYNLCVSTDRDYAGFFGSSYGTVKNLGIASGRVIGHNKVGGLAGYARGTITNCFNRASVKANTQSGGLVGQAGPLNISNCYNNASVTATGDAGGIVGYYAGSATGAVVKNSYHTGTLKGKTTGGIAASIHSNASVTFKKCYVPSGMKIAPRGTKTSCSALSAANLKASVAKLGSGFCNDSYRAQNGGYPRLNVSMYHMTKAPALRKDSSGAYCIDTADQLRGLAYMVNVEGNTFSGKTIKLCADIDLKNKEWIPIGGNIASSNASYTSFCGKFDGCGHVISNLSITSGNYRVGLFGTIKNGSIKNLGIDSGIVIGQQNVGGIVGSVTSNAVISSCYNKANIRGSSIVGGITSMIGGKVVTVENCYNTGSISSNSASTGAGIIGYIAGSAVDVIVRNCYGAGNGGYHIVGNVNERATKVTMEKCRGLQGKALVGTRNSMTVSNSGIWTAATFRKGSSSFGSAFAPDYLVQNSMFPVLKWENGGCATSLKRVNGVYQISTAEELRLLSYLVRKGTTFSGKKIVLTADIDLENEIFLPIGGKDESSSYQFKGHFDGQGHIIRNLNVQDSDVGYLGLFGYINNATIQNVGIESGIVIGGNKVAGLVGYANKSTIRSCYNKAKIYGTGQIGGIVGQVGGSNCVVENCYNVGFISSKIRSQDMAGLIGYIAGGTDNLIVKNSYSVGNQNGIVGIVNETATNCVAQNSYSVASVTLVKVQNSMTKKNSSLISADTLKGYASVLGAAFEKDTKQKNDGYPVLSWEND